MDPLAPANPALWWGAVYVPYLGSLVQIADLDQVVTYRACAVVKVACGALEPLVEEARRYGICLVVHDQTHMSIPENSSLWQRMDTFPGWLYEPSDALAKIRAGCLAAYLRTQPEAQASFEQIYRDVEQHGLKELHVEIARVYGVRHGIMETCMGKSAIRLIVDPELVQDIPDCSLQS